MKKKQKTEMPLKVNNLPNTQEKVRLSATTAVLAKGLHQKLKTVSKDISGISGLRLLV